MGPGKFDFIKEKNIKKSSTHHSFLDWLIENSSNLMDFIISRKEIESQYLEGIKFNFDKFVLEFSSTPELQCYYFCRNKYNGEIYHITKKGRKISPKYSDNVINKIVSKEYETKNVQTLINESENINARACIKRGVEKFYKKYKCINLEQENISITGEDFFSDYVFPSDEYLNELKENSDFKEDYKNYLNGNYGTLDIYLESINELFSISGLNLIKENNRYMLKAVPKSYKEIISDKIIMVETRYFGSFNLTYNSIRLDGSYGDHTFRDSVSGRFYSIPSYDNYGHDSSPDY